MTHQHDWSWAFGERDEPRFWKCFDCTEEKPMTHAEEFDLIAELSRMIP